jgi:hypothetical protein
MLETPFYEVNTTSFSLWNLPSRINLSALYSFIITTNESEEAPTRFGNILLLAPALKALTQLLIENMTLTK